MLPGMICENVCDAWANNDDVTKLTAIILTQATLNFQNVCDSLGNNDSLYKNDENALRFKGIWWEPLDGNHEKEGTTTENPFWEAMVLYKDSHYKLLKCAQVPSENARTRSTWLNHNYF